MDPARRKTITALAGSYIRENQHKEKSILPPWTADFIPGKGQGQVFLLHGKPGVGKTYTAGEFLDKQIPLELQNSKRFLKF